MQEELVTFETAKLAEEKGFDIIKSDDKFYDFSGNLDYTFQGYQESLEKYERTSAPTQSLLQKWLREVHNIDVSVRPYGEIDLYENNAPLIKKYDCRVDNWNVKWSVHDGTGLVMPEHYHFEDGDYKVTLEKGLQEALKLI